MNKLKKVEKCGETVWQNERMDLMRKEQCLCLNCGEKPRCLVAPSLFRLCTLNDIALMVTRCPDWEAK